MAASATNTNWDNSSNLLVITGNLYVSNSVTTTNVFATTVSSTSVIGTHYGVIAGSNTVSASTQTLNGTAGQTTLNVTGNVYVSNALTTTNVLATNVTGTSVIGTHYGPLAGSNTVSASTQTLNGTAGQTTLNVTGNVYASNAVTTTNVFATNVTGTSVIGTHYGSLAGSNTVSASTVTASGTANFNGVVNLNSTFSFGALGRSIRNILCGTTGSQQITGNGPLTDFFNIGTTLAGTSYLVFMTPVYGAASHVIALQVDSKTTSRVNFQVARVDASSGTTTYVIDWMIIDLN